MNLPDISQGRQASPLYKADSFLGAFSSAQTTAEALELVDIGLLLCGREAQGLELATVDAGGTAAAQVVIYFSHVVSLPQELNTMVDGGPDGAAVRIVAVADAAQVWSAKGKQCLHQSPLVHLGHGVFSFVWGKELYAAAVGFRPPLPLIHTWPHAHAGEVLFVGKAQHGAAAGAGHKRDGINEVYNLKRIFKSDYLAEVYPPRQLLNIVSLFSYRLVVFSVQGFDKITSNQGHAAGDYGIRLYLGALFLPDFI